MRKLDFYFYMKVTYQDNRSNIFLWRKIIKVVLPILENKGNLAKY